MSHQETKSVAELIFENELLHKQLRKTQECATLRDQFAMAALTGLIASTKTMDGEVLAKDAYTLADAMLKQREEGRE